MNSDWQERPVSELEKAGALLVQDGNHGNDRPRPDEFASTGTAFIRAGDLAGGRVLFDQASRINDVALARIRKGRGLPGDVLLSHKGTVGRVALVPTDAPPFVCSPQTTFWRVLDPGVIDRRFLLFFLRSPASVRQLTALKGQTDMADYVSLTDQREMTIILPSIQEQRRIAGVLGALDDKIEHNLLLADRCRTLADHAFRHAFPLVAGSESLGAHVCVVRGRSYTSAELVDSSTALVTLKSIKRGGGYAPSGLKPYGGVFKPEQVVAPGELLVAHTDLTQAADVIGKPALVPDVAGFHRLVASLDLAVVRPASGRVTTLFLYHLFLREEFQAHVYGYANGSTVLHLSKEAIPEFEIRLPEESAVLAFEGFARPLHDRARWAESETARLVGLRDALLPKLVSSLIRVSEVYEPGDLKSAA